MNERIDKLLWQAGGYTKLSYPNDTFLDGRYALTQLQLDKFAELIVKECVNVVDGGSFLHDQAPTAIFAKECSAAIKRHFDIK
jgi:hypothetical protein